MRVVRCNTSGMSKRSNRGGSNGVALNFFVCPVNFSRGLHFEGKQINMPHSRDSRTCFQLLTKPDPMKMNDFGVAEDGINAANRCN